MSYAIPTNLPWDKFVGAWEEAEEALARLDQALASSALKTAWLRRADFEEAAAALWLEGDLVPLEDLVLDDANTNARAPSHELFQARSILLLRRRLGRQEPLDALKLDGLISLQETRDQVDEAAREDTMDLLMQDPDWLAETRLEDWLYILPAFDAFPALPATAVALHAWNHIQPFQQRNETIGRLLAPPLLWRRQKIDGQALCLCVGLKALRWFDRPVVPLESWIKVFCRAVTRAAQDGLKRLQELSLAQTQLARRLEGRRKSSRLPALAELILEEPLVSAPMVARKLDMSQQAAGTLIEDLVSTGVVRELTGRSRFRAYAIA
ncbi:DUF1403 family protein [Pelagibius sp. Alg239-R121]|uniref:DUF1403 family protein n=1 Tax=Pelagibius sp. Alg239-R121 TaxID=2993448 RepID=UPI0024A6B9F3|nr:DUF1403 family protein [Pelagibius sp. Alg239-R121]